MNLRRAPKGELVAFLDLDKNNNNFKWINALAVFSSGELVVIEGDGTQFTVPHFVSAPYAAAFSPANGLISFSNSQGISVFDGASGRLIAELTRIKARINALEFDRQGESLIIGASDSKVYRWKYNDRDPEKTLRVREQALERYVGHTAVISQVQYHPAGRVFFSADWVGQITAWVRYDADPFEGEYLENAVSGRPFTAEVQRAKAGFRMEGVVEKLRVTKSGELLVSASDKGDLTLTMVRGFRQLTSVSAHSGLIYDMDVSPDGETIITLGRDRKLRSWRVENLNLESSEPTVADLVLKGEAIVAEGYRARMLDGDRVLVGSKSGMFEIVPMPGSVDVSVNSEVIP
jgi:WD40 repeat protein